MRDHPHLIQLNADVFLRRLSGRDGRPYTLGSIPEAEWVGLRRMGFDAVWLMGLWERSEAGRRAALQHPELRQDYDRALPGWGEADVGGSPYAILDYVPARNLGTLQDLRVLGEHLRRNDLCLILDFVPNHLARDHPWTRLHPDRFVQATEARPPEWFFASDGPAYLAHGRDPHFPPWTDTVQVDFFSPGLRRAWIEVVQGIAELADGVRCDMAMLALNEVFERTWGEVLGDRARPQQEFWEELIASVKRGRPDFLFMAEAYWGLEPRLLELGFDCAYDKTLYDRLRHAGAGEIRAHLESAPWTREHAVRFIENHDEERALPAFGRERSMAAAVAIATLPGVRLYQDGQMEGRRIRLPVQLRREPEEAPDRELMQFYGRLLAWTDEEIFHRGRWRLLQARASEGNAPLAWAWRHQGNSRVVIVNYTSARTRAEVMLGPLDTGLRGWSGLSGTAIPQAPGELILRVELDPWEHRIFDPGGKDSSS